ncbi:MAG: 2Fe-2S iron-sulfur cluster-binding protein [Pacificimonas sp.]|jgi:sarcosine oxidase subunit alpha|nr:2Fe-2S iron-sulfur cluster-binding protein [Pacificimonas sp.]
MSAFRLPAGGSSIDRSRKLGFTFAGRSYSGFDGDTLASALAANGVSVLGRSFKYHRPRGQVATGHAETNALVQLEQDGFSTANVPATTIRLYDGLVADPVNCSPSPRFDVLAINQLAAPLLSAGFYYKTFMQPSWHFFEGFIRRAAGLGRSAAIPDPQRYGVRHARVKTLLVANAPVDAAELDRHIDGRDDLLALVDGAVSDFQAMAGVQTLPNTRAVALLDHGLVLAVETVCAEPVEGTLREKLHLIRAEKILLAPALQDQPLVFANNDRPGILLLSAARDMLETHGIAPGRHVVVAGPEAETHAFADRLRSAGTEVAATIATDRGECLIEARGRSGVNRVRVSRPDGQAQWVSCDSIVMQGGMTPAIQLFLQDGGRFVRNAEDGSLTASSASDRVTLLGKTQGTPAAPVAAEILQRAKLAKKSFVDFQTDVTVADIQQAVAEGYETPDHLKRYTVLGMGTDQGRLSAMNGARILAEEAARPLAHTLPTKARPPAIPTSFAALGARRPTGELIRPRRLMPADAFHRELGAVMDDYGWERPSHYTTRGETIHDAAQREARAVRETAGLFDGSPLGKIEVKGPQAGAFLDHIYVGRMSTLKQGKVRYGLMLNENGSVFDDGVVMRLGENHYLLNCTSGHADRVFAWVDEYRQCIWPYDVLVQNVTSHWATFGIAGPRARDILTACDLDFDLERDRFPHMAVREGSFADQHARIARVSFSGELSYELSVPVTAAMDALGHLWRVAEPLGIVPYGIEALEILRVEKGYLHVGADTDSETQPGDIGFGAFWPKKPADFIGRRSLLRAPAQRADRKQLVGLRADDDRTVLPMGGHIIDDDGGSIGWIGSSYYSPNLRRGVTLAMLEAGQGRHGERVTVFSLGDRWQATVSPPTAFDSENIRVNA